MVTIIINTYVGINTNMIAITANTIAIHEHSFMLFIEYVFFFIEVFIDCKTTCQLVGVDIDVCVDIGVRRYDPDEDDNAVDDDR